MTNPQLLAWLDQDDARITSIVRRFGWFVQYVGGDCDCPDCDGSARSDEFRPPFAYTVGLFGLGHPELLVFGLEPQSATGVLNDLGGRIRAGTELMPGEIITFETGRTASWRSRSRIRVRSPSLRTASTSGPPRHRSRCCS
jgi:hypothetical protein